MRSLFKKELFTFFGTIIGYLVLTIFILVTGLFLWVIPGGFNIIESERASLAGLFELAPWVYLLLIPAITMRMFAEEKRTGTIELLVTRPISAFQIIVAKYFAALFLVFISLMPVVVYLISVYLLGNPVGNIDTGATTGSMIGLFLLASIYIAIGLFASSLSSNQVIAFLLSIMLSYLFYLGFDFAAYSGLPAYLQSILLQAGIHQHYASISRGVIDSRDVFYYLAITFLFLGLTRIKLVAFGKTWRPTIKQAVIFVAGILLISTAVTYRLFRIDLTVEKRYSLSKITRDILKNHSNTIHVEIYLTGDLPAGMKEFQQAIIEKLEDFSAWSGKPIFYKTFDIYSISSPKERSKVIEELAEAGIQPVSFNHKTTEGLSTKQIFPGVYLRTNERGIGIDLLKRNPLLSGEENLKQSIELLEYELIRAVRLLQQVTKPTVAFLRGHGEASPYETSDIRYYLDEGYTMKDISTSQLAPADSIDVLIIADPQEAFSDYDKLQIDQFIMRGGRVLWCIDPVFCSIDSLSQGYSTLAFGKDLRLTDQLFKYGVRMNPTLLQDALCAQYPVNTAPPGQPTTFTPAPFYFSPLATPSQKHPLSRNLSHVFTEFVSSIEPVGKNQNITTTPILTTSEYARTIETPTEVSLIIATAPPDKRLFRESFIPIGLASEGIYESVFQNRLTSNLGTNQNQLAVKSEPTRMVFIADGGIIKNKVKNQGGQIQILPLGYDQYSRQTFGNREFILNCIDYLTDKTGILELRTRVVKLRLLDKVKIREHKLKVQLINTLIPIMLIILTGFGIYLYRKRKYS